jgi:outer membrane protein TolC
MKNKQTSSRTGLSWPAYHMVTILCIFIALPLAALAQTPLSLEKALSLAIQRSTQFVAHDAASKAARDMGLAAGQLPDPILKLGINNLPIDGADRFNLTRDFMTMRSIGVMQEFTGEDKRKARRNRFEKEGELVNANRNLTANNVRRNTAKAWLDSYYQDRILEVLVRQRDEAKLQIETSDAAYRGGRGSLNDAFAARTAVVQIEDRIAMAELEAGTSKIQLGRWIGDIGAYALDALPLMDRVVFNENHLDSQLLHHPQIAVMQSQEVVAQADADTALASKHADWTVEIMLNQRGSAYSNMASINASIPWQWDQKNRQDREVSAKLAMVEQLSAERADALRDHSTEIRVMLQEWRSNLNRLLKYDGVTLPLAKERTNAALAAYRGGVAAASTLSAVLEVRRMEVDVQLERLRLEKETARLWAQLNYQNTYTEVESIPRSSKEQK